MVKETVVAGKCGAVERSEGNALDSVPVGIGMRVSGVAGSGGCHSGVHVNERNARDSSNFDCQRHLNV